MDVCFSFMVYVLLVNIKVRAAVNVTVKEEITPRF